MERLQRGRHVRAQRAGERRKGRWPRGRYVLVSRVGPGIAEVEVDVDATAVAMKWEASPSVQLVS